MVEDWPFVFLYFVFCKKVTYVHTNKKDIELVKQVHSSKAPPLCSASRQDARWSGPYSSFRGQPTHTAHIPA